MLHAPYGITQAGITAPAYPPHGPWRRVGGQAVEADLRTLRDTDSDDDGLLDGAEVALGADPNDADTDDDTVLDGSDNCPFISNLAQTNSDALPAGNACQCGDVTNDGVVNATDAERASESLVGRTLGGTFVPARCNVVGPNDGGPTVCDVGDLVVIDRIARGLPATLLNACNAYRTP